jgi:hypothetical protein
VKAIDAAILRLAKLATARPVIGSALKAALPQGCVANTYKEMPRTPMRYFFAHWDPHLTLEQGLLAVVIGCLISVALCDLFCPPKKKQP